VVTLGLPYWLGYVSVATEFLGGMLLVLGLLTRVTALFIAVNMLVALGTVGIHQGFGIYSYITELAAIAILLVTTGSGALALDRRFGLS
jgi:putative oxidoreductase